MKPADAKDPKFDEAWWKKAKAKPADPTGKFGKTLAAYEAARDTFLKQTAASNTYTTEWNALEASLKLVIKEAKTEMGNKNLGTFQKETLLALKNYTKDAEEGLKKMAVAEKDPDFVSSVDALVKTSADFKAYCKANHQFESFNFLSLMQKGAKKRFVYDDFIKSKSKFEVNITSGTKKVFDQIAKDIAAGTKPESDASWKPAPWDKATKEIDELLAQDMLKRFRSFTLNQLLKGKLPT